jgi:hypothetical protein
MVKQEAWEYRFQRFGSTFREAKDEEIEAALDEWGAEGWEVIDMTTESNKVILLARRPLSLATRRQRSMPEY